MTITIIREELTRYSTTVEVSDAEGQKLIQDPSANTARLGELCKATDGNWMDSDTADYEVEQEN